jgi:hypothetical protein
MRSQRKSWNCHWECMLLSVSVNVRGKRRRNDKEEYKNIQVRRCGWKRDNGKEWRNVRR